MTLADGPITGNRFTLDQVRAALHLPDYDPTPAQLAMAPDAPRRPDPARPPRPAAVLALLYPHADHSLRLILTRRTDHLRGHSGQISFPGGKHDPTDPSLSATALRETHEELGIAPHSVALLGRLATVYIPPSNFNVTPYVGYTPALPALTPNPDEVAEVFSVALADLLDPDRQREEERDFNGTSGRVPYYALGGHKVWGATAIMLSELAGRLRSVT